MAMATYNGHDGAKRQRVQDWLNAQWRVGALPRPMVCEACLVHRDFGRQIDAHLENYDDPTNYTGLCATCHLMLHSRHRAPDAWARYKLLIATGYQHEPAGPPFGDFKRTVQRMAWRPPRYDVVDLGETYLDLFDLSQHAPGVNLPYNRGGHHAVPIRPSRPARARHHHRPTRSGPGEQRRRLPDTGGW